MSFRARKQKEFILPEVTRMKTPENWALDADDRPKFNVVMLYEDSHTGKRAKHFYDNVIRQFEDECDFNLELWNFQMIAIPEIADSTAQAAAQADLVIVSLHGKVELPGEIRNWIERWPRLIVDRDPALVALLDKAQKRRGTAASTLAYLRSVADGYGVSFFAHTTFSTATGHLFRKSKRLSALASIRLSANLSPPVAELF